MADSEGAEEPQAVAPLSVKAFVLLLWIRNFEHLCWVGARGSVSD